jgi:hypothetical protein
MTLSIMVEYCYAECRTLALNAECHYAECRSAVCDYAECHGTLAITVLSNVCSQASAYLCHLSGAPPER